MAIALSSPLVLQPAITVTSVTLDHIIDNPSRRIVQAFLSSPPYPIHQPLTLWEGNAYDAVGDWTQSDADARIVQLLS